MYQETLPQGITLDEPVRLSVEADLLPDGTFGRELLVVTDAKLRVLTEDGAGAHVRLEMPLAGLKEPKAESVVGGGVLEVSQDSLRIELVRYSSARIPRFTTAAKLLEKWLKGEEAKIPPVEEQRCPRCGLPLEKGTKVCPACLPKTRTLRKLVGYLGPCWKAALALSLIAMGSTAVGLIPPYLQKPLMDQVLSPPSGEAKPLNQRLTLLALLVAALLGVQVVRSMASVVQGWLSAWLGNRITHDIRCQLYRHLQYLSLRFYDKRELGGVISRVNQDTGQLQAFLVWGTQDLAMDFLLLVGIGAMLFTLNWKLALLVFIPAPIVAVLSTMFWMRIRFYMHRFFHRWGRLNALLNETLTGLRVVKVFAQEPREVARFNSRSQDLATSGVQAERIWSTLFSGLTLLILVGTLLVWYIGGRSVLFQEMSLGTLVAFMTYVLMFYQPVQSLSMLLNWSSRSLTAAERVFEVLDIRPEVAEADDAVPMPRIEGRVEFRGVTFGYEPHRPVLKSVGFDVKPGEMIGLVGQSGAGKTTTINLLCRFYDADEGEILIDGIPIRKIRVEDLRHQLGVVPQDTFLFSGTIADNISYAKPGATQEEVIRAAKIANAHDFILRKPDGYETWLGEGGQGISAGEKQRLAIARAVLHDPRILILDEATSQVDVETEKQIQEAISRLVKGRTTFAIAHRLSTLKNADRLIVLKEGAVTEIGTHDELIAKEGEFAKLVKTYQEISKVREVAR